MGLRERNRETEVEGNLEVGGPGVESVVLERVLRPLLVDLVGPPTILTVCVAVDRRTSRTNVVDGRGTLMSWIPFSGEEMETKEKGGWERGVMGPGSVFVRMPCKRLSPDRTEGWKSRGRNSYMLSTFAFFLSRRVSGFPFHSRLNRRCRSARTRSATDRTPKIGPCFSCSIVAVDDDSLSR